MESLYNLIGQAITDFSDFYHISILNTAIKYSSAIHYYAVIIFNNLGNPEKCLEC